MPRPQYKYIWHFDNQGAQGQEAPELIVANGNGNNSLFSTTDGIGRAVTPDIPSYTYVNVSREYAWTLNDERDEVPRIILKEMTPSASSTLTRATYWASQLEDFEFGLLKNHVLDSYDGLYITDDTGFFYDLPQLEGSQLASNNNAFGAGDSGGDIFKAAGNALSSRGSKGGIGQKIGKATQFIDDAVTVGGLAGDLIGKGRELVGGGAGYFTEQPQFYQHGQGARSYDVKFPLYNTGSFEDLIRNFQLAFMLVYQNLPNRNSKQTVRPPCMYEVTVPGISYCPWTYLTKVQVDFVGARREMTLPLPFEDADNFRNVRVTVPEAYDITLSIQELVSHTKNFMFHNVNRPINTGVASIDAGLDEELDPDNALVNAIFNPIDTVGDIFNSFNPFSD